MLPVGSMVENLQNLLDKNLNEYNEIINLINKYDFKLINGKIINEKKELCVMESYWRGETQYESYGTFKTIRKFFIVDLDVENSILNLKNENECKEFLLNYWEKFIDTNPKEFGAEVIYFGYGYLMEENITVGPNNNDSLIEYYLSCDYGKWDGYISFFKTDIETFYTLKDKEVDVEIEKHIR